MTLVLPWSAFPEGGTHLDESFGKGGVIKISFGAESYPSGGAVQSDGKLVVAGSFNYEGYSRAIALTRVHANGTLDEKFGNKGIVITKVGINSRSTGVAIMPDGRIVIVGWSFAERENQGVTLAMYHANGTLDTNFGDNGLLIIPDKRYSAPYAYTLAIQPDGKILVGGEIKINLDYNKKFFLARVTSDGALDTEFGEKGKVVTDVGGGDVKITALALQQDGKIIASGIQQKDSRGAKGSSSSHILARYNSNGSLDKRFGNQGLFIKTMKEGFYVSATVSVLPDGRVYLIDSYSLQEAGWLLLSRLNEDGSLDSTFGQGGTSTSRIAFAHARELFPVLQPDGKVLICGPFVRLSDPPPHSFRIGVSRFLSNGQADNSFGLNGTQIVPIGAVYDYPAFMTVQKNGRIVVVGYSKDEVAQQIVLIGLVP